jgi:hypothetical protein
MGNNKLIRTTPMESLIITATSLTPSIRFESTGSMEIHGKSIPENSDDFWSPILNWFKAYVNNPAEQTVVKLDIAYLNISSSKNVLHLLYQLNELTDRNFDARVEWYYHAADQDMLEVGKDYEHMVRVPFFFKIWEEEFQVV